MKLLAILLLLAACAVTEKRVEQTKEQEKPTVETPSVSEFEGEWKRADYDRYLVEAIKAHGQNLLTVKPKDWSDFTNAWPVTQEGLINFWARFAVEVAKWESNWKPETKYRESFGVWSRGLFQISKSSSNQARYRCNTKEESQLHQPAHNIECFIKILNYWVGHDKRIAGKSDKKVWIEWRKGYHHVYYGCGRYFSVCRDYRAKQLKAIQGANK